MRRGPQVQILLVYVDGFKDGYRPTVFLTTGSLFYVLSETLSTLSGANKTYANNELIYVQDTQIFVLGDGVTRFRELYHDPQRAWMKIADV